MTVAFESNILRAAGALALTSMVMACGGVLTATQPPADTHTLTGVFEVPADELDVVYGKVGELCLPAEGWDDLGELTTLVVRDAAGVLIGKGAFAESSLLITSAGHTTCEFAFSIGGLPDTEFYVVEVDRRPAITSITFSADELEAQGWAIHERHLPRDPD